MENGSALPTGLLSLKRLIITRKGDFTKKIVSPVGSPDFPMNGYTDMTLCVVTAPDETAAVALINILK